MRVLRALRGLSRDSDGVGKVRVLVRCALVVGLCE